MTVITTASPKNFDYLKSLGADHIFSYADPSTPTEIKKITDGKLCLGYDAVVEKGSTQAILDAFADDADVPQGKKKEMVVLLPIPEDLDDKAKSVTCHFIIAGSLLGREMKVWDFVVPADKVAYEFSIHSYGLLEHLLQDRKLQHHRLKVLGGLEHLAEGFEYMKSGKVSGEKIVYHPLETKA